MIESLDHIAVAVRDLDRAASAFGALLGRKADWREEAAGARHAWFQLANTAIDLVQADGPGESGERVRAQIDAHGEGLWGLAFGVPDLDEARRMLARRGAPVGEPADLLSTDAWRLAFLDAAATHGVSIALAERTGSVRAKPAAPDAVAALDHVVINTTSPERAVALYGARLGLDFRLERSNPQWGSKLMFFRCGGAVVEVGARLGAGIDDAPDRLSGLAWRIVDPDAAQARLAKAGFDVSEVRPGRKPGTRVFTVRSGVPGAPTLMLSAEPGDATAQGTP
ncbi:MAG TPA: VOC family protein [Caulobacteraceae bacterium]|jgi:catechol 2,3-dioxygenase-like lactoylglutathione lyase family enzyme|nr:VOC family protein [Caulobacteraceae bacterium]